MMLKTRMPACLTLLVGVLWATSAAAETPRTLDEWAKLAKQNNLFTPWTPPPAKPKPRPKPGPKPKTVVKDVREELMVTGIFYDNVTSAYQAMVETRDGSKKRVLAKDDKAGQYTVKIVLGDRLGLADPKGKLKEVGVGETFEGDVVGRQQLLAGSGSSSTSRPRRGSGPAPKPLPKLSDEKKMSVLERLKARRKARMEAKKAAAAAAAGGKPKEPK